MWRKLVKLNMRSSEMFISDFIFLNCYLPLSDSLYFLLKLRVRVFKALCPLLF